MAAPGGTSANTSRGLPWIVDERRGAICATGVLLLVGLTLIWQASLLDFGQVWLPGPGFFPLVLGVALSCLSIATLIGLARRLDRRQTVEIGHRDVLIACAAMIGAAVAFEGLGAYLTLGAFSAALLILVGKMHPLRAVAGSSLGLTMVWYFFKVLLGLQLPNGPF